MDPLMITPKTKIFDLLEAYPELEDELIRLAPEFRKLKNPLLRKTIAKVATLAQAATLGGLSVETLVNRLRACVGQQNLENLAEAELRYQTDQPDWFSPEHVHAYMDIREMLNRGEQPVHEVISSLRQLRDQQILQVTAPFVPAPLIDKSISLGYRHWIQALGAEEFNVYFSLS